MSPGRGSAGMSLSSPSYSIIMKIVAGNRASGINNMYHIYRIYIKLVTLILLDATNQNKTREIVR